MDKKVHAVISFISLNCLTLVICAMISTIHDSDLDLLTFCRHRHFLVISEASDMVMLGGLDLGI